MHVPRLVLPTLASVAATLALGAAPALAGGPIYRAAQTATDPQAQDAWHLRGDGPMGIESAWDQTTGSDAIVAVIDTGLDMNHPELRANLWTNPGEVAGNGVDDDRDGFVDDVHGADVVNHDGEPWDDNGHGTHVAGIIGARGGNDTGAAGVAWHVRLMPIKVLDGNAAGDAGGVAAGVRYAVAHGARIINLSLSGPGRSDALESAITAARDAGVLVVAAAGNDGRDLGSSPSYPASYTQDNVLGVAATGIDGRLSSVSNFGAGVDLAAPGEGIFATARGGGYELRTGTSMATPMVAGTAALLQSIHPEADWRGLAAAILGGARRNSLPVSAGSLDVAGSLRQVIPADLWHAPPSTSPSTTPDDSGGATRGSTKKSKKKAKKKKKSTKRGAASRRAKRARKTSRRKRAAKARRASSDRIRTDGRVGYKVP